MFRILITVLFFCECCVAMESPRGQFLDFIKTEASSGLEGIKERITTKSNEKPYKELADTFIEKFGECFDKKVVPIVSSYSYSEVMFTAARAIGMAYMKDGQDKRDVVSLDIALAFFQSVPNAVSSESAGSDSCFIDIIEVIKKEKADIERRNQVFEDIAKSDPSEFFK